MTSDTLTFHLRRANQEIAMAIGASSRIVEARHAGLAALHSTIAVRILSRKQARRTVIEA